jgi:hypothetical protein|tara:strand:- start:5010 stop:5114 length:105 start_codon:yes stop_codon:yes gene_type:complete
MCGTRSYIFATRVSGVKKDRRQGGASGSNKVREE